MLKVLSLFSGIGAFEKALDNLECPYELVNFCEFDKYAVKSYCAIHNVDESKNLGDITKVDEKKLPKDIDILTYGFPCQDISLAGKQKGLFNDDGTQTRSGLFFEALRIIEETKPKIAIAENVKNLLSKKFNAQFQVVLASLESAGYNNYYQVLNAKNFGVPQNRERVFIVSIRKDIDNGLFEFPKPFPLKVRLKDVLEEVIDEKYYLTQEMVDRLFTTNFRQDMYENRVTQEDGVVGTLRARDYKDPKCVQLGQMYPNSGNPQAGRVYAADGISPTMDTCSGGNRMPKVLVREATKKGYAEAYEGDSINLEQINSTTRRGRVGKQMAQTLTTSPQQGAVVNEPLAYDEQNGYIRKDGTVGTIMTDGSSPKKNNRVLVWDGFNQRVRADSEVVGTLTRNCGADLKRNGQGIIEKGSPWVSEKGVKFILSPKRGMCTDVNPDVVQPLTAKGQQNWTGSFVSPDIESLEKSTTIGSTEPVKINLKNGETITSNDDVSYLRIRKLTPKECFRLMGFDDESFHKAEAVNSNTQLYKQAGNSIVVDVLEELFCRMLDEEGNIYV